MMDADGVPIRPVDIWEKTKSTVKFILEDLEVQSEQASVMKQTTRT